VEEKGYVLNTDALVGSAVIKGRVIGKLASEGTLEIHSSARIKGTLAPGTLVVPAGHHFHWPEPLQAGAAEIAGEWAGTLLATGTVRLRGTARFFGDIRARGLVVEAGAVFVGAAQIQPSTEAKG
jgi:cytoskeletal protein CcmA (bactofilin family)